MNFKFKKIYYSSFVKYNLLCVVLLSISFVSGCSLLKTMQNVSRLKFKLNTINNLQLTGVELSNKRTLKDFNAVEILKLSSAVAKGSLPLSFTLHINALNPNNGTGGYPRTDLKLSSFPWRLLIDNKEIVTGNIASPIPVPGVGEAVDFPLQVNFDLYKFFKDKGYEGLINLALKLTEFGGSSVDVKLAAQPSISTPVGNISYPGEMMIVHSEYR